MDQNHNEVFEYQTLFSTVTSPPTTAVGVAGAFHANFRYSNVFSMFPTSAGWHAFCRHLEWWALKFCQGTDRGSKEKPPSDISDLNITKRNLNLQRALGKQVELSSHHALNRCPPSDSNYISSTYVPKSIPDVSLRHLFRSCSEELPHLCPDFNALQRWYTVQMSCQLGSEQDLLLRTLKTCWTLHCISFQIRIIFSQAAILCSTWSLLAQASVWWVLD